MKNIIQNVQLWINRNREWFVLILGLITFILISGEDIVDFGRGMLDGYNDDKLNHRTSEDEKSVFDIIPLFFILLLFLFIFGSIVYMIGNFFYQIFFKLILQKDKLRNIISFVLWLFVLYNLSWEGIHWLFLKFNAFDKRDINIKNYRSIYASLLSFMTLIIIIVYTLVKNFITNTKTQAKLIAQKSQAELMALKAQINPHFLFNVLNNLYGSAIVEDSPKTSEGILQLSSIMRHVVEGTKNERIDVEKEIRFLNDYIELNKMRIPNRPNIRIITEIFWDENPTMIAPLLVIPYLENSFKYGISTTEECFIEMSFRIENQQLSFVCKNSIIKTDDKLEVGTGTGLDNTKRRLDLYYPTAYQLSTSSSENIFAVNLEVKL